MDDVHDGILLCSSTMFKLSSVVGGTVDIFKQNTQPFFFPNVFSLLLNLSKYLSFEAKCQVLHFQT